MPLLKRKVPSYRLHRPSGRALVTLNGKDIYLGTYGSDESKAEYDRLIAEWLANQRQPTAVSVAGAGDDAELPDLTVDELFLAYWEFAREYYVKDGKPTGELEPIRQSEKAVTEMYGTTPVARFGPRALEAVRSPDTTHMATRVRCLWERPSPCRQHPRHQCYKHWRAADLQRYPHFADHGNAPPTKRSYPIEIRR